MIPSNPTGLLNLCGAQFPYTEAIFSESLRLYPPAHATNRHAVDGLQVGGVSIPKGAMVFL